MQTISKRGGRGRRGATYHSGFPGMRNSTIGSGPYDIDPATGRFVDKRNFWNKWAGDPNTAESLNAAADLAGVQHEMALEAMQKELQLQKQDEIERVLWGDKRLGEAYQRLTSLGELPGSIYGAMEMTPEDLAAMVRAKHGSKIDEVGLYTTPSTEEALIKKNEADTAGSINERQRLEGLRPQIGIDINTALAQAKARNEYFNSPQGKQDYLFGLGPPPISLGLGQTTILPRGLPTNFGTPSVLSGAQATEELIQNPIGTDPSTGKTIYGQPTTKRSMTPASWRELPTFNFDTSSPASIDGNSPPVNNGPKTAPETAPKEAPKPSMNKGVSSIPYVIGQGAGLVASGKALPLLGNIGSTIGNKIYDTGFKVGNAAMNLGSNLANQVGEGFRSTNPSPAPFGGDSSPWIPSYMSGQFNMTQDADAYQQFQKFLEWYNQQPQSYKNLKSFPYSITPWQ